MAKYLICKGWGLQFRPKTAVVKTYPIPKRGVMRIDSLHHVSATHRAKEERQDAPLLERRREQTSRWRPGGAATCAVSRRDQLLTGGSVAQGDRGVRRGCRPCPDAVAVPGGSLRGGRGRCIRRSASPVRDAASSSAAMGRLLAGRAVVAGASARSVLDRSAAAEPKGDAVGSYPAGSRHLPTDHSGQRMAAAPPMVRQQRDGRSPRCRFWPGGRTQALCLPRSAAGTQRGAVLASGRALARSILYDLTSTYF